MSERGNSFRRLMKEEAKQSPALPPHIRENVKSSMGVFRYVGNVVELYVPRIFSVLVQLLQGSTPPPTREHPGPNDGKDPASRTGNAGPRGGMTPD